MFPTFAVVVMLAGCVGQPFEVTSVEKTDLGLDRITLTCFYSENIRCRKWSNRVNRAKEACVEVNEQQELEGRVYLTKIGELQTIPETSKRGRMEQMFECGKGKKVGGHVDIWVLD